MTSLGVAMAEAPRAWTANEVMLVEAIASQAQAALESARLRQRELRIANALQDALQPALPAHVPGLSLGAYTKPALDEAQVGGDFYDVFALDKELYAVVIGDVSGKGLAAATQLATVRNMLRGVLYQYRAPAPALTGLNSIVTTHGLIQGFVTLFAGLYDARTGEIVYASCGHEPGLLHRAGDGRADRLGADRPAAWRLGERRLHGGPRHARARRRPAAAHGRAFGGRPDPAGPFGDGGPDARPARPRRRPGRPGRGRPDRRRGGRARAGRLPRRRLRPAAAEAVKMPPFLETERLLLRRFTAGDADFLYDLDGDPDVIRFTNLDGERAPYALYRDVLIPRNLAYYDKYPGYGYWVAVLKATGADIGWFHFRPARHDPGEIELGYRLRKSAWGKGYGAEGARALIRKGFEELGTSRITATALAANRASVRVMEKCGLRHERDYAEEFTDPATGEVAAHAAVKYALGREDFAG